MPKIIIGIGGSGHSLRALEWAMKEAAIPRWRQAERTKFP
jgi:hypothetical protein